MKAIILAAGRGRRLSAAARKPKCLVSIGSKTLIARLLASLHKAGVDEAVIVVGYEGGQITAAIGDHCGGMPVRYVVNPEFEKGAILSLWAARAEFDDDLVIMDADVFCPDALVERLVRSPHRNCLLLDGRVQGTGEEMMLMARNGRVLDIGRARKPGYDTVGESVGFFKVARESGPGLAKVLRACLDAGGPDQEHEEAYLLFMRDHAVGYERVDDLPWTEIDFPEDIEHAERKLLPLVGPS